MDEFRIVLIRFAENVLNCHIISDYGCVVEAGSKLNSPVLKTDVGIPPEEWQKLNSFNL
ncbi:MAG: hypothetical protein N2319_12035 [Candidatus Kapabacteria bacterium]|nr:hypothetical protein [Candidatus Kapabacteria bacterium]